MTQDKAHPTPPAVPSEWTAFEAWAHEHLGRGYSLAMDDGVYLHPVTRWAFKAYKAGRAAPVASNTTAEPAPIQPAGVEVERDATEWKARYEARELEAHQLSEQIIKLRRFEQAAARYYWLIDNRSEYVWNNCLHEDETRGCFDVDAAIDQALAGGAAK